jgi:hypothetical protein
MQYGAGVPHIQLIGKKLVKFRVKHEALGQSFHEEEIERCALYQRPAITHTHTNTHTHTHTVTQSTDLSIMCNTSVTYFADVFNI